MHNIIGNPSEAAGNQLVHNNMYRLEVALGDRACLGLSIRHLHVYIQSLYVV